MGVQLLLPWGTFTPILVLLCHFIFELEPRKGQTDRQAGKTRIAAY